MSLLVRPVPSGAGVISLGSGGCVVSHSGDSNTPPITTNMQLWLDFTDTTTITQVSTKISAMTDKSGNGNDFAQSNATLRLQYNTSLFGSKGGAIADKATGPFIISNNPIPAIVSNNVSAYAVVRRRDSTLGTFIYDYQNNLYYLTPGYNDRLGGAGQGVQSLYGMPVNQTQVIGNVNTGVLGTSKLFSTDGVQSTFFSGAPQNVGTAGGYFVIGAGTGGAGTGADFDLACVLIYSGIHTTPEINATLSWLKSHYGLTAPTATTVRTVFAGDSFTQGFESDGNGFPSVAMSILGYDGHDYLLEGNSGGTISTLQGQVSTVVAPYYSADVGANKNVVALHIGTNDIATIGVNIATVQSDYQTLCTAYQTAGFKVVCSTILPRHSFLGFTNPNFEADRQTFNTWLRANYLTFADRLADIGADPNIGAAGACESTTYFNADKTHPNTAGHAIIGDYFAYEMAFFLKTSAEVSWDVAFGSPTYGASGSEVTKDAGASWQGGMRSNTSVDGFLILTGVRATAGQNVIFGISNSLTTPVYNSVRWNWQIDNGDTAYASEDFAAGFIYTQAVVGANDVYAIQRVGDTIKFRINGVLVATSTVSASGFYFPVVTGATTGVILTSAQIVS